MKLLPEKYGQAAQMTVCEEPETNAEECGHWYSPAAVARMIVAEREACAKICESMILQSATRDEAHSQSQGNGVAIDCANAIRARK